MQYVGYVGPTEAVDALCIVANHADGRVWLGEERENAVLRHIGVLVLVDEDVAEPLSVAVAYLFIVAQQEEGLEQQVIEVQGTGCGKALLV